MIVDGHVHIFEANSERYPWNSIFGLTAARAAPVEELLAWMEASGVDRAVLVQPSFYGYNHQYLVDCLHRYPNKFAAVGLVDPRGQNPPAELEHLVQDLGICGLRLLPLLDSDFTAFGDRTLIPLWEKAAELDIPICLLIGLHQLNWLEPNIGRFPEVKVVIDHLGRVIVAEGPPYPGFQDLLDLAHYPNTYVKLSALSSLSQMNYPHQDIFALIRMALNAFGPKRLIWGTDFPFVSGLDGYIQELMLIQREISFLDENDKSWTLGKAATTLWPLV